MTKRFKLAEAWVYYGSSRYPLNGVDAKFEEVDLIDGEDILPTLAKDLSKEVGRLTGYPRDFQIKHIDRQEFKGVVQTTDGTPESLVIPEHIYAWANGYGVRWELEQ